MNAPGNGRKVVLLLAFATFVAVALVGLVFLEGVSMGFTTFPIFGLFLGGILALVLAWLVFVISTSK